MTTSRQPERETGRDRVRRVLDRLVRDGTAHSRSDGSVHRLFPVAVGPAEGAAIRSWAIREAAVRTIEIGLGYAISTLFLCQGLLSNGAPDARHVAAARAPGLRTPAALFRWFRTTLTSDTVAP